MFGINIIKYAVLSLVCAIALSTIVSRCTDKDHGRVIGESIPYASSRPPTAVATPSEPISSSHWPEQNYQGWFALPADVQGMAPEEMAYWRQWCAIIQDGITNRANAYMGLSAQHTGEEFYDINRTYRTRQTLMLERLAQITPPERIMQFHNYVIDAGRDQMRFFDYVAGARAQNNARPYTEFMDNADLKSGDKKLWAAYYNFQAMYPQRTKALNDAIEMRLCGFDLI